MINNSITMEQLPENVIHVTGFGVFRGFTKSNPSWEAVSILRDHFELDGKRYEIVKHNVPVTYTAVDDKVREIWSKNPKLVIHCGAHQNAKKIHLERNAFNGNFLEADSCGQKLECGNVKLPNSGDNCTQLFTKLNLQNIINVTDSEAIRLSDHPGDYLCGYIYLKSLDMDQSRSLFIHVPPPNDTLTIHSLSDGIFSIIEQCIKQLDNKF